MPAQSKSQQRFMGMVRAAQKGEKPASKTVAKVAKKMDKDDVEDFASTKHKGLPNKVKKETKVRKLIRKMVGEIMREGFAGALKKEDRKKFDNTRRKQSEVLGYTLTGTDDLKAEIDDATVKEGKLNESQLLKLANSVIKTKTETKGMSLVVAHHIINTYNSYKKSHPKLAKQVASLPINKGIKFAKMIVGENKLREAIRKIIREDFAGAYPEHQRKKFDNKRRKQSEVLGYKLTGVNDVRTEIDDATVRESIKKKLKPLVREIMYSIGAGGMTALETGVIHLEKNSCYYMGASSSPDKIIVTKVDDNWIEYVKPIDNNSKKMKIERAIGESLILDGSNTWLKTYGRFKENKKIADTLQKNLDGKKGPNNGKVPPSEFDRYVLTVKGTKGSNDVYGAAKQWGVIGDWNGKSGEEAEAEIEVYKTYIPQIKKDKQFKVTKQKKGELK